MCNNNNNAPGPYSMFSCLIWFHELKLYGGEYVLMWHRMSTIKKYPFWLYVIILFFLRKILRKQINYTLSLSEPSQLILILLRCLAGCVDAQSSFCSLFTSPPASCKESTQRGLQVTSVAFVISIHPGVSIYPQFQLYLAALDPEFLGSQAWEPVSPCQLRTPSRPPCRPSPPRPSCRLSHSQPQEPSSVSWNLPRAQHTAYLHHQKRWSTLNHMV